MFRACELKDQTYKKTRTLHFLSFMTYKSRLLWHASPDFYAIMKPRFYWGLGVVFNILKQRVTEVKARPKQSQHDGGPERPCKKANGLRTLPRATGVSRALRARETPVARRRVCNQRVPNPHPQSQSSLVKISVWTQISNGKSYRREREAGPRRNIATTAGSRNLHPLSFSWGIILKPQPPHTRQTYEQKYGCKTVKSACFEAFRVILCPDFCSYFCLVCGGRGRHSRVSEVRHWMKHPLRLLSQIINRQFRTPQPPPNLLNPFSV